MEFNVVEENKLYRAADGSCLRREYGAIPESDDELDGEWVLRDASGKFIDFDRYRFDLASRRKLKLNWRK